MSALFSKSSKNLSLFHLLFGFLAYYFTIATFVRPFGVFASSYPFKIFWAIIVCYRIKVINLSPIRWAMKCFTHKSMNTTMNRASLKKKSYSKISCSDFVSKCSYFRRPAIILSSNPSKIRSLVESRSFRYSFPYFRRIIHGSNMGLMYM